MTPQIPLLTTILSTLLLSLSLSLPTLAHTTPSPLTPRCTNALRNPGFETSQISPWLDMVSGSWSKRSISTSPNPYPAHSGSKFYYAHSNATHMTSTLTLAQSYFELRTGDRVRCGAWVRGQRPTGTTRVQVWLDAAACGGEVLLTAATNGNAWMWVGGQAVVRDVMGGVGHSVAVTLQGEGVRASEGWSVAVDDVSVGVGC
ncbi:hypothetical protein BDW02DRAFT_626130 [Decorospora gaudefroyi]|uniref:Concanavalin A-like lectin/glucanase n=1 Tax=Decorospora gaudefroyi TaxID=184978 RepID=A0A6A5KXE6_9PLEO|nr:hypothetical protein BDW02DRAFT_626130 [Decorospora gaudefroyi]